MIPGDRDQSFSLIGLRVPPLEGEGIWVGEVEGGLVMYGEGRADAEVRGGTAWGVDIVGVVARLCSGDCCTLLLLHGRQDTSLPRVPEDWRGVRLRSDGLVPSGPETTLSLARGIGRPRPARLSLSTRLLLPFDIIGRAVTVLILVPAAVAPSCLNVS